MMRILHRWFSLPLSLFIVLVIATGIYLQFEEAAGTIATNEGSPSPSSGPPPALLPDVEIQAMVGDALARSREEAPDFRPNIIQLALTPGRESTRLAVQPRGGPFVEVDRSSGATTVEMNPSVPLHVVFIRLHTGSIAGPLGIWIVLFTSLILAFLSLSGLVLYYQMWVNRQKRGRGKLFWK